jgi:hypothetical protein
MKTIIIIIIIIITTFFFSIELSAQNIDSLGLDNSPFLNKDEVTLLNSLLEEQRNSLEFTNLKVAFITGSNGGTIVTKSDYFKNSVIPWIKDKLEPQIFMVKLTKEEKEQSGGYDVFVLSWVKVFTSKTQEKIIEQLNNTN